MKFTIILALLLAVSACTRGPSTDRTGMIADVATTTAGIASGEIKEANPVLSGINNLSPAEAAVTLVVVKYGMEKAIEYAVKDDPRFAPDFAKMALNATGTGAACWNAGLIAGAAMAPPLALAALACAAADWQWRHFAFNYPWDKEKQADSDRQPAL